MEGGGRRREGGGREGGRAGGGRAGGAGGREGGGAGGRGAGASGGRGAAEGGRAWSKSLFLSAIEGTAGSATFIDCGVDGVGITEKAFAETAGAEPSSLIIASTTSPTVCVRESAATSCASTLSSFCTSERISTRLIESTPSSVSSAMSISIMSGS